MGCCCCADELFTMRNYADFVGLNKCENTLNVKHTSCMTTYVSHKWLTRTVGSGVNLNSVFNPHLGWGWKFEKLCRKTFGKKRSFSHPHISEGCQTQHNSTFKYVAVMWTEMHPYVGLTHTVVAVSLASYVESCTTSLFRTWLLTDPPWFSCYSGTL